MTTEKIQNYTLEQAEYIKQEYLASQTQTTIERLAVEMGKTTKSIVAKLAQAGVYQRAAKAAGQGKSLTKAEKVLKIAQLLEIEAIKLESLEKAKVEAIDAILLVAQELYQEG